MMNPGTFRRASDMQQVSTSILDIGYETGGAAGGEPVVLFHGWPDDARTYSGITPLLQDAGMQTFVPWLRGFGPTRFRSPDTMRSGDMAAMAQDALDFADALGIGRFSVVGHDWGARIVYLLAAAVPERIHRIAVMSIGWSPGELPTPTLKQAERFWYQWFMATQRGEAFVRAHPKAFARHQWETWSPPGWFSDQAFEDTAASFENPDWVDVTLHAYRVRWGEAAPDPRYAKLQAAANAAKSIAKDTLLIHGASDRCVLPETSEHKEPFFSGAYQRCALEGVGHFPTREATDAVARLLVNFLTSN